MASISSRSRDLTCAILIGNDARGQVQDVSWGRTLRSEFFRFLIPLQIERAKSVSCDRATGKAHAHHYLTASDRHDFQICGYPHDHSSSIPRTSILVSANGASNHHDDPPPSLHH